MAATSHAQRRALGDYGERLAERTLAESGMTVLARNWSCRDGEIDIVAADGSTLVGCEVKTRRDGRHGTPLEAVGPEKAARVVRLARRWAAEHDYDYREVRLDVVTVLQPGRGKALVEHLRGVC